MGDSRKRVGTDFRFGIIKDVLLYLCSLYLKMIHKLENIYRERKTEKEYRLEEPNRIHLYEKYNNGKFKTQWTCLAVHDTWQKGEFKNEEIIHNIAHREKNMESTEKVRDSARMSNVCLMEILQIKKEWG